ncbi:MAG: type II secretion system protein [Pseudomonadota bacterium]
MLNRSRQQGFTLIELVIVIVILGILAAIAIPKFISLQREARIAAVDGFYNALKSGSNVVYAKAAANGNADAQNVNIDLDGDAVNDLVADYGYPEADTADLQALFDDLSARHNFVDGGNTVTMTFDGVPNCQVTYTGAAAAGQRPAIVRTISGC